MDRSAESGPAQGDPSGLAPPTAESQPRHPRLAAWAPWVIGALWIGLVAVGAAWAREPLARREILFETPVRIAPGVSVTGAFTPEVEGPCVIELRFHEAWLETASEPPRGGKVALEALGRDVGGGFVYGSPAAPGFAARYAVSRGGASVLEGETGDRFVGTLGYRGVRVTLAWIDRAEVAPQEVTVRIDRAVDGLRRWDARLVVAAAGDRISYASLEAQLRGAVVLLGALVSFALGALAWVLFGSRSRRKERISGGPADR